MVRGKRWTQEENELLREMIKKGMSGEDILKSGKFPHRTVMAIQNQMRRLGSFDSQRKKSFDSQIRETEIVGLESIVKRYVDAFNKICDKTDYDKVDLERFRIIFMAAWKYRDLFAQYERVRRVEEQIKGLQKVVEEIKAQLTRTAETN
ncbi:MAG: hypothetical protein JSV12_06205 [Candidatus Bathyarchaeota archaeon]|nr:MAG: hypothetical protein JSV12_06205 [Candidatus Bathyarchaeota archaeon]